MRAHVIALINGDSVELTDHGIIIIAKQSMTVDEHKLLQLSKYMDLYQAARCLYGETAFVTKKYEKVNRTNNDNTEVKNESISSISN